MGGAAFAGLGLAVATANVAAAIADYTAAARLNPNDADAPSLLAWFLATTPDEKLRNGPKAVAYAQKACELSEWKNSWHLNRLAVAHAASGNFEEAVKWEQKALELPGSENEQTPRRARLDLFKQKQSDVTR